MERFLCSKRRGDLIIIDGQEFKHLRVLRLKKGEKIQVFCDGRLFLASLWDLAKDHAICNILEEIPIILPRPKITVYQCLPVELKLIEEVIDRVSQAGAMRLVPLLCKRGFHGSLNWEEKLERWKRISIASFKQCKRPTPMEISLPIKITDLYPQEEVSLILDNFTGSLTIKDVDLSKESYGIVVGPEGGFSREEVELLKSRGFSPLLLRPYIYRSEMAGAIGVALIMNLYESVPKIPRL